MTISIWSDQIKLHLLFIHSMKLFLYSWLNGGRDTPTLKCLNPSLQWKASRPIRESNTLKSFIGPRSKSMHVTNYRPLGIWFNWPLLTKILNMQNYIRYRICRMCILIKTVNARVCRAFGIVQIQDKSNQRHGLVELHMICERTSDVLVPTRLTSHHLVVFVGCLQSTGCRGWWAIFSKASNKIFSDFITFFAFFQVPYWHKHQYRFKISNVKSYLKIGCPIGCPEKKTFFYNFAILFGPELPNGV